MNEHMLNQVVMQRTGTGHEERLALVTSYADHPTVGLEDTAGEHFHWAAHLCRSATPEEAVRYWRERAERAEQRRELAEPGPGSGTAQDVRRHLDRVLRAFWTRFDPRERAEALVTWELGHDHLRVGGMPIDTVANGTATLKIEIRVNGGASNT